MIWISEFPEKKAPRQEPIEGLPSTKFILSVAEGLRTGFSSQQYNMKKAPKKGALHKSR